MRETGRGRQVERDRNRERPYLLHTEQQCVGGVQGEEVLIYSPLNVTHLPLQLVHSFLRRLGNASLPEVGARLGGGV